MMNYLLLRKNNQQKRFLYKKYNAADTSKIELNWCKEATNILAPLKTVIIPRITCIRIIDPKIITGLNNFSSLFFKTT